MPFSGDARADPLQSREAPGAQKIGRRPMDDEANVTTAHHIRSGETKQNRGTNPILA